MNRIKRLFQRPSFRFLLLEFLVILSSVLMAFALNNWSETQKNKKMEIFYLEELSENLHIDISNLKTIISHQEKKSQVIDSLLFYLPNATNKDQFLLDSLFLKRLGNNTFFPNQGAYKAMLSEGSLDLIKNKELLTSIIELYEQSYIRIIYLGTVLDGAVEKGTWEEKRYYSFHKMKLHPISTINLPGLISTLEHRYVYIQVYLSAAHQILEKTLQLQEAVFEQFQ